MSEIKIYKIRGNGGMFSSGGNWPRWSKKGKVWNGLGPLSNHINQLSGAGRALYKDDQAEVVEIIVREEFLTATPISAFLERDAARKNEREQKSRESMARWQREQDLHKLAQLQKKYPDAHK